jgi:hypothetical protein
MDVNSNSHAEQFRADSHAKDTRPGATVPSKDKKVTRGNYAFATWPDSPSFLADTNTAPLHLTFVPFLFFSPFSFN